MDTPAQGAASGMAAATACYPRRSFEALLYLVRAPSPELLEALRGAGFDPDRPQEHYPREVWCETLDLVRRQLFPDLPRGHGLRALGCRFVGGFTQTVVGRVLATTAAPIGPERVMARLPGYLRAGAEGLRVTSEAVRAGVWRVRVESPGASPEFFCGLVEEVLRRVRVPQPSATLLHATPGAYEVLVCWRS